MQKVVIANVLSRPEEKTRFTEIDLPDLSKLLTDGYKIVDFHQIAVSDKLFCVTMTFILEKPD